MAPPITMDAAPVVKKANQKVSDKKPCGLLYLEDNKVVVLGGRGIGYTSQIQTELVWAARHSNIPYVGVRMFFPRAYSQCPRFYADADLKPKEELRLTIKLLPGSFTSSGENLSDELYARLPPRESKDGGNKMGVITLKLNDGCKAEFEEVGIPFMAKFREHHQWVNGVRPIQDFKTLRDICGQRTFTLLMKDVGQLKKAQNQFSSHVPESVPRVFPYTNGPWDMKRYKTEIPRLAGERPYDMATKLDSYEDRLICITQGVVQDVFYLSEDVNDIRSRSVECIFIRTSTETSDEHAREFIALVWYSWKEHEFALSLPRLLKDGSPIGLAFWAPPKDPEENDPHWRARLGPMNSYKHTGCDLVLNIQRPYRAGDPNLSLRNRFIQAVSSPDEGVRKGGHYLKLDAGLEVAKRRVEGANELLADDPLATQTIASHGKDPVERYLKLLRICYQKDFVVGSGFPTLLNPPNSAVGKREGFEDAMDRLGLDSRPLDLPQVYLNVEVDAAYRKALERRMGAYRGIFQQYMEVSRLGIVPIVEFAGSGKTEMLVLVTLMLMASKEKPKIYCATPSHVVNNFAERLYRLASDVGGETGSRTLPMVVRGYDFVTELSAFSNLMTNWGEDEAQDPFIESKWSRNLSLCEWTMKVMGYKGFDLREEDNEAIHKLREMFIQSDKYLGFRKLAAGEITLDQVSRYMVKDVGQPQEVLRSLMEGVLMCADAVCTTPHVSGEGAYQNFNRTIASATVLDEAGAMSIADALLVWCPDGRICIMAGDERQLAPVVMSLGEVRAGKAANMFAHYAKVSILEHAKRSGWPCLALSTQY